MQNVAFFLILLVFVYFYVFRNKLSPDMSDVNFEIKRARDDFNRALQRKRNMQTTQISLWAVAFAAIGLLFFTGIKTTNQEGRLLEGIRPAVNYGLSSTHNMQIVRSLSEKLRKNEVRITRTTSLSDLKKMLGGIVRNFSIHMKIEGRGYISKLKSVGFKPGIYVVSSSYSIKNQCTTITLVRK